MSAAQRTETLRREPAHASAGGSLYERDFAVWIEQQVALLRSGDSAALDVPNLVEEFEGLTNRDVRALGSQLKRIMTPHAEAPASAGARDSQLGRLDPQWARAN
jgi:hypothetical protein